jgi:diadenosine tetraphosphate (Ap4A) HIT family hydrolase
MGERACEFCEGPGGAVLWQDDFCRVVGAGEAGYPGFCRVILERHVREMTDLTPAERSRLMDVVFVVEEAVREAMSPDKMNVASLGNMTPHVHWHVIPRFQDDAHFPSPVWAAPRRDAPANAQRERNASRIAQLLRQRLT